MTHERLHPPESSDFTLHEEFRRAAFSVADLARRAGFRATPYRNPALPYFSRLSREEKEDLISSLKQFTALCHESMQHGCDIKNSRQLLWYTIRRLGFKPPLDMFDHIDEGDIIAIHSRTQQLFRNFEHFDFCSYTLEELGCVPWTMLYKRPEKVEEDLLKEVNLAMDTKQMVLSTVGEHIVEETFAPLSLRMGYRLKFVSPLFYKNSTATDHHLVCIRAELKEPALTGVEEEELLNLYYRKQGQWQEQNRN